MAKRQWNSENRRYMFSPTVRHIGCTTSLHERRRTNLSPLDREEEIIEFSFIERGAPLTILSRVLSSTPVLFIGVQTLSHDTQIRRSEVPRLRRVEKARWKTSLTPKGGVEEARWKTA